ncbi:hypothetical protein Tco_0128802 [Tanacetum coccineum]
MKRDFLSQKGSRGGRGVKEKNLYRNTMNTSTSIGLYRESDGSMNEDTLFVVASAVKEVVTPSVVNMTVEKEKRSSLEETSVLGSFPPLSTPTTTTDGNAHGKSSYANVTGKPSGKKLNFRTLFTPGGNGIDVVVPVDSIHAISKYGLVRSMFSSSTGLFSFQFSSMDGLYAMLENGPWFIQNTPLILKKLNPDENLLKEDVSTILVWVKLHGVPVMAFSEDGLSVIATKLADVELKDNIVVAMPKITTEGHYTCNIHVEYEWKPPRCASCVPVGLKVGFKPHKEYRHVPKKPAASFSSNKKKVVEPTIEVSNSNPFEFLNSVDNDVKLGTGAGTTNLVNNEATSSGSSFMNIRNSSTSTTPILDKITKFEELLTSGKATLVDEAGNLLKKAEFLDNYDSEDEIASVDNDMARFMASERVGRDLSQELQAICDNLDIRVQGRKKK